jgi:hypothetical protein
MNADYLVNHFALALVYSGHVDGDRSRLDPEFPMPPHKRGDLRRMNHVLLGRQATLGHEPPTYFRSTTAVRFPFFGHRPSHQFAGCAGAKNEHVVFFCCVHNSSPLGYSQSFQVRFNIVSLRMLRLVHSHTTRAQIPL